MQKLYSELAQVYYEMYNSLFDYEKEFKFYDPYLQKYKCKSVLELGCGNGNLAPYFQESNYDYTGSDISFEMLEIALKIHPTTDFINGDMRTFHFTKKFDSIIIQGRSFCYMTNNDDVMKTLTSIHKTLNENGILIFDNFNAKDFLSNFKKEHEHSVTYKNRKYKRLSFNSLNLKTGWTWNWKATYYIEEEGKETKIINDESVLRAFTKDEICLFLKINNFEVLEIIQDNAALCIIARNTISAKT